MPDNCGWNASITRQDLEIERIHLRVTETLYTKYESKERKKYELELDRINNGNIFQSVVASLVCNTGTFFMVHIMQ